MNFLLSSLFLLNGFLWAQTSTIKVMTLRLSPGQDVKKELERFISEKSISAASILSAVGSLTDSQIRYANKKDSTKLNGPLEVVSLSGTAGIAGSHFHIAVSDGDGKTLGGHLMDGNLVYTTLEIVIGVYPELDFKRSLDPKSGYKELDVQNRKIN